MPDTAKTIKICYIWASVLSYLKALTPHYKLAGVRLLRMTIQFFIYGSETIPHAFAPLLQAGLGALWHKPVTSIGQGCIMNETSSVNMIATNHSTKQLRDNLSQVVAKGNGLPRRFRSNSLQYLYWTATLTVISRKNRKNQDLSQN